MPTPDSRRSTRRTSKQTPAKAEANAGKEEAAQQEQESKQEQQADSSVLWIMNPSFCPEFDLPDDTGFWPRVLWVRSNLPGTIKKDKDVGPYRVTSHEYINTFLLPLLNEAGLVDWVNLLESERLDTGLVQGTSERPVIHHHGRYNYHVQNIAEREEGFGIKVEGIGEDTGDKGPGKASTYALKQGRKVFFSIAAGDAEEDRPDDAQEKISRPKPAPMSPVHLDEILKLIDDFGGEDSVKAMENLCKSQAFKGSEVAEIPDKFFESCITLLGRWKKGLEQRADKNADTDDIPPE